MDTQKPADLKRKESGRGRRQGGVPAAGTVSQHTHVQHSIPSLYRPVAPGAPRTQLPPPQTPQLVPSGPAAVSIAPQAPITGVIQRGPMVNNTAKYGAQAFRPIAPGVPLQNHNAQPIPTILPRPPTLPPPTLPRPETLPPPFSPAPPYVLARPSMGPDTVQLRPAGGPPGRSRGPPAAVAPTPLPQGPVVLGSPGGTQHSPSGSADAAQAEIDASVRTGIDPQQPLVSALRH
jgi:hypothetical protein